MTVICIDDDVEDTSIFTECIRRIDPSIKSITANDGPTAIKFLSNSERPDFIFLDVNMPKMTGRDVLASIKGNYKLKNIPVIMYSGSINHTERRDLLNLGARGFLDKQDQLAELEEALRRVLKYDGDGGSQSG
jgi:CheY-like chemotaxis protein